MGTIVRQKTMPAKEYDVGSFPVERLQAYADETNRAIASGLPVKLIDKHVDVDDPKSVFVDCGWVEKVFVEDNWLGYELNVTEPSALNRLRNGTVKYTSPEFKSAKTYNNIGDVGPHIRHVALTGNPRNPNQGPFEIVGEGVLRFSLEDSDMDNEKDEEKNDDVEVADAGVGEGGGADGNDKTVNPDLPKDEKAEQKAEALVALFSQIGIELPADWSFDSEGAVDILMAGLKTKAKVESESKAKEEEKEDPPGVQDSQQTMQFSEEEIAALPESMRAKARKANKDAIRFSEEREAGQRTAALATVNSAKIPPGLRKHLADKLTTIRFSESGEQPTLTVAEVVSLVEKSLPPSVQFDEADVREVEQPEAGAEMSPAEAEAYARRIHSRRK